MFNLFRKKQQETSAVADDRLITPEMTINQILTQYPMSAKVFAKYGITCSGCSMAGHETLRQGIAGHGIPLEPVLTDLNKFAQYR